jgi:hypothetical protein
LSNFGNKGGVVDEVVEVSAGYLADFIASNYKGFAVIDGGLNEGDVLVTITGELFIGGGLVANEPNDCVGRIFGQYLDKAVLVYVSGCV